MGRPAGGRRRAGLLMPARALPPRLGGRAALSRAIFALRERYCFSSFCSFLPPTRERARATNQPTSMLSLAASARPATRSTRTCPSSINAAAAAPVLTLPRRVQASSWLGRRTPAAARRSALAIRASMPSLTVKEPVRMGRWSRKGNRREKRERRRGHSRPNLNTPSSPATILSFFSIPSPRAWRSPRSPPCGRAARLAAWEPPCAPKRSRL